MSREGNVAGFKAVVKDAVAERRYSTRREGDIPL